MDNSINQNKSLTRFLKGSDFVTFFAAVLASMYGLALVYSATYSSLNGLLLPPAVWGLWYLPFSSALRPPPDPTLNAGLTLRCFIFSRQSC